MKKFYQKSIALIKEYLYILKRDWLLLAVLAVLMVVYLLVYHFFFPNRPSCIPKQIFGMPCPGCGITRAYVHLFQFRIVEAFWYHPLFWLLPIIVWVIIFKERPIISKIYSSKLFWILAISLYLGVYIYRMIRYFPSEPMEFYPGNIIGIFGF